MDSSLVSELIAAGIFGIAFVVLAAVGVFFLLAHARARRRYAAMRAWPSAPGQVTSAGLAGARRSRLAVTYTFTVDGATYAGRRVALNPALTGANAQAFIQQHPPGSPVEVFYDPAQPALAYLDRTTPPSRRYLFGGVAGLAASALFGCLAGVVAFTGLGNAALGATLGNNGPDPTIADVVAFAPAGQVLAGAGCGHVLNGETRCAQGSLALWDTTNPAQPRPLGNLPPLGAGELMHLAYSPNGATLAVADINLLYLINLTNPADPRRLGTPITATDFIEALAYSPDGKLVAAAGFHSDVQLWDVSNPAAPRALPPGIAGLPAPAENLAFSPDGQRLATVGFCNGHNLSACPGTITLWDVSNPAQPKALAAPFGSPNIVTTLVAFGPDGKLLVTGADNNAAELWDVSDPAHPRAVGQPLAPVGAVYSAAFSPDGKLLALGTLSVLSLWDVSSPAALREVGQVATTETVDALAYDPGGATVAGVSNNHILLWNVSDPTRPYLLSPALVLPIAAAPR